MEIKLEPISHTYTVDGIPRPSQSALSDLVYGKTFYPDTEIQEEKRNRGNDFHRTTQLVDQGKKLKSKPVTDRWVRTWGKFKSEYLSEDFVMVQNEGMLYVPSIGYCTTVDRAYYVRKTKSWAILDIKTGSRDEIKNRFQLAAGLIAVIDNSQDYVELSEGHLGINFFLIGDEDYDVVTYPFCALEIKKYRNLLASAVVIWNERIRVGKLQEEKNGFR